MSETDEDRYRTNLEHYEQMVATNPDVKRRGATMPYTSVNGHMFSFLAKDGGVALRLPPGDREEFLERYDTQLSEQYGRVMREYVDVPDELLRNQDELKCYFDLSYSYVRSLEPKPTKR